MNLLELTCVLTALIVLRYLLIAGGFYFLFYQLKIKKLSSLRIEAAKPKAQVIKREVFWSVGTSVIFGFTGACAFQAWEKGLTKIYLDIHLYGWTYFFFSIFLIAFLHDTYFYWMHRLVHHKKLFPIIHKVHHDSNPPTPFAAFSFHWTESILEALILPALIFFIPVHIYGVLFLLVTMTVTSVINHLGYEIYSKKMQSHRIGKWFISATNHQTHHRVFNGNYGLYFTWWDFWMGTLR